MFTNTISESAVKRQYAMRYVNQQSVAMVSGYGQWIWSVAMVVGYGQWLWSVAIVSGYGQWLWLVTMIGGYGQ